MTTNAIQRKNNFDSFKEDFKKDTGSDIGKETMHLYISYFNARMNDLAFQVISELPHQLLNKLDVLPDEITV